MANVTGTTQVPAGISAWYDTNLLKRALPATVHDKWGQQRKLPKGQSDSIKFRKWNALSTATTALTEGVTPSGSALSTTDITATVSQYGDYTYLTDKVQLTSPDNAIREATDVLGEQAGQTLDEIHRDVLVAGTAVRYASAVANRAAVAANITTADIDSAIRTLKGQNAKRFTEVMTGSTKIGTAPVKSAYIGITHPDVSETLEGLTGWKGVEEYASQTLVDMNEIGSYKYVRFVETTAAKIWTGAGDSSADVYATLVLGKDAYGVVGLRGQKNIQSIIKPLGSAGTADPLNQRASVGWTAWTTAKILNDNWMVRIETKGA